MILNDYWHTWLSSPRVMSMKKKRADQKGEAGRLATAVGYTTNARPAPGGGGQKSESTMVCQRQKFLIRFNDKKIKVQIAIKIKRIHCRTREKKIIIAFKEYNCSLSSIKRVNQS